MRISRAFLLTPMSSKIIVIDHIFDGLIEVGRGEVNLVEAQ